MDEAIEKLSKSVCQELTGSVDGNEDGQREFIESLIEEWLSTNKFVKLDLGQSLPDCQFLSPD